MKSSHHLEAVEDQGYLWRVTLRKHNGHPSFQKIVESEDASSVEGIQGLIWIEQLLHLIKALWQREDEEKKEKLRVSGGYLYFLEEGCLHCLNLDYDRIWKYGEWVIGT